MICDRNALNGDNVLFPRQLTFRVQGEGTTGSAKREEDLAPISGRWDSAGTKVQVALALKPGTTVDTIGATADVGYTAEMKVILPQIGYPAGRGDGILFLGITHFDGDSFTPPSTSYGTRTWFMREGSFNDGAAWAYMDPSNVLAVPIAGNGLPREFAVLDNYPNPFNPTTQIQYDMPEQATISLKVYNILGQEVMSLANGVQPAGHHTATWDGRNNFGSQVSTGVYFYRFEATGVSGQTFATLKKMILMK